MKPEESVVLLDESTQKLHSAVKLLVWMCLIIAIITAGSFGRSYVLQDQLDRTEKLVIETENIASGAQTSADAALTELRNAIARIEQAETTEPDLTNQAILDALQAIARIEGFVCGGPCPTQGDN